MSTTQSTAPPPSTDVRGRGRPAGLAALAVAAAVLTENVVLAATGARSFADPVEEVLAYYADHRGAVAIASGLVALYLPLLMVFVTRLHGLVTRRGGAGADWSSLAVASAAALAAVFVLVNVLQVGLALSAGDLTEPTPVVELVWQVHAAAFGLALPMLGATFAGTALAAHASGLTPPWQRTLGLAGGGLLLAAGVGNLAIADGSPLVFVGLVGFAAWLVWMVATGVRLLRS
ncbi:hypothetical protein G7075_13195 [Phycicoccus sp. HDW14]|uniref:hypothetical protein n=1 Tax=Phycicoccus sp. HDW14 TaxID=2714941 RepID=UPI00140BB25E|nr:hypothetical protein [Phycicoccus sp. HDW14]QIM21858.1 hypothetical protein G7075_13195 [Phycicoccus sp. HDW14]